MKQYLYNKLRVIQLLVFAGILHIKNINFLSQYKGFNEVGLKMNLAKAKVLFNELVDRKYTLIHNTTLEIVEEYMLYFIFHFDCFKKNIKIL